MKKQAKRMRESEFPISLKITDSEPIAYNFVDTYYESVSVQQLEDSLDKILEKRISQGKSYLPLKIEGDVEFDIQYLFSCPHCSFSSIYKKTLENHSRFCFHLETIESMRPDFELEWKNENETGITKEKNANKIRKFGVNPYALKKFSRLNSDEQEEVRGQKNRYRDTDLYYNTELDEIGRYEEHEEQIEFFQKRRFYAAAKENYMFINNIKKKKKPVVPKPTEKDSENLGNLPSSSEQDSEWATEFLDVDYGPYGAEAYRLKNFKEFLDEVFDWPNEFYEHVENELNKT